MPLWAAGLLLVLCVSLSVLSFRYCRNRGGKVFLAAGIVLLLVCLAAVVYIGATALLVSGIK
jgi:hypothetical protein